MAKKNFILMSMEDSKIKKISNVIGNDSCRKILDYLAEEESTESELSKKLNIPISTVHYNLLQLVETGLIESREFHYSKKGKEVSHYRLANKYIIIAPKNVYGIKEKLRSILPVALIAGGAAVAIQLINKYTSYQAPMPEMMAAKSMAYDAAVSLAQEAPPVANPLWQNIALWFFAGAVFALLVLFIMSLFRKEPN